MVTILVLWEPLLELYLREFLARVRHGDLVYGYTCGWNRRVSVSVDTAVGLAISHDQGKTFQRTGTGPVLAASLHEPCLVGDGFVKVIDQVFHMWYIFGTGWKKFEDNKAPDRTYKIGHAVSADGIHWTKEEARQIISDQLGPDESQALPTVITIGKRHHMFFCFRQSFDFRTANGRGYRIGHAWSDDLHNWTRDDDNPSLSVKPGEWDSDMQCYPHVFECDGKVYLLYNGNEFGRHGFGLARLIVPAAPDFRLNQATALQIEQHLQDCDTSFIPSLSSRVAISDYAKKIKDNAMRFEAWSDGVLVGLVAAYCNNTERAFITSVSVLPGSKRNGIAKTLLQQCIAHLRSLHIGQVCLEVGTDNVAAKTMYERFGFTASSAHGVITTMEFNVG